MNQLVFDANVFIDLEKGDLLGDCFQLPYQCEVLDVLYEEELKEYFPHLLGLGIQMVSLGDEFMIIMLGLRKKYPKLSRYDVMTLALAIQRKCFLITGDQDLRKAAEEENVEVHGTIWVVENMVTQKIISKKIAEQAYEKMQSSGRRLPWNEAYKRLGKLKVG